MRHRLFLLALGCLASAAVASLASGCGDDSSSSATQDDAGGGGGDDASSIDGAAGDSGGGGDAQSTKDGGSLSPYCKSTLDYQARCFPNLHCNTKDTCDFGATHGNAAFIEGSIQCQDQDTACTGGGITRCALEHAAAATPTAGQTTFVQDYCAKCGDEFGPGCTTKLLTLPDAGKLTNGATVGFLVSDDVLNQIDQACLQGAGVIDAGPDATAADGGVLSCDDRFARCAKAVTDGLGAPTTVCN